VRKDVGAGRQNEQRNLRHPKSNALDLGEPLHSSFIWQTATLPQVHAAIVHLDSEILHARR